MHKIKGQTTTNSGISARDPDSDTKKSGIFGKLIALFDRRKTQATLPKATNSPHKPNFIEKFFSMFSRGGSQAKSYVAEQNNNTRNISNIKEEIPRSKNYSRTMESQANLIPKDKDTLFKTTFSADRKEELKKSIKNIFQKFTSSSSTRDEQSTVRYPNLNNRDEIKEAFRLGVPIGQNTPALSSPAINQGKINEMCDKYINHAFNVYDRLKNKNEIFSDDEKQQTSMALEFFKGCKNQITNDEDLNQAVGVLVAALDYALEI